MEQEELQYDEGENVSLPQEDTSMNDTDQNLETELEAIKARVKEMEEEAEKIKQIQTEVDRQMSLGSPRGSVPGSSPQLNVSIEEKMEIDLRSVYVGNVDYAATAEELEQHFHGCGAVNRVTILVNKFDGHPKGFAYIEFSERDSVNMAMTLDESLFRGRQLKVLPKRTNKPGISSTNRLPRYMRRPRRSYYRGFGRRPSRGRIAFFHPY